MTHIDAPTAAARLSLALRPSHALAAHGMYGRFAAQVVREAGPQVLADIVSRVERHASITRRAAA